MGLGLVIIFVLLVAVHLVSSDRVGCGRQASGKEPSLAQTRIFGGEEAIPHSWPWLIDFGGCSGTLLRVRNEVEASDIVLTAGHCNRGLENWRAYAAVHHRETRDHAIMNKVVQVKVHPQFNHTPNLHHDLMLLKLQHPLNFTDKIRPICLPRQGEGLPIGKTCYIAGWGITGNGTGLSKPLKQLLSPVHTLERCKQIYGQGFQGDVKLCAGPDDGSASTCPGDSGGPLMCLSENNRWVQYGIDSYGAGACGPGKKPTTYHRVSHSVNWIMSAMRELSSIRGQTHASTNDEDEPIGHHDHDD